MPNSKLNYLSKYVDGEDKKSKSEKKKKKIRKTEKVRRKDDNLHYDETELLNDYVGEKQENIVDEIDDDNDETTVVVTEINSSVFSHRTENEALDLDMVMKQKNREESIAYDSSLIKRNKRNVLPDDSSSSNSDRRRKKENAESNRLEEPAATRRNSRNRHDSFSDSESSVKSKNKRSRHDSSSDDNSIPIKKHGSRTRHDSSSDDNSNVDGKIKAKMSSGHVAGLQTGEHFSKKELKIQQKKKIEATELADKYGVGETVYRDKSGRRVLQPVVDDSKKIKQLDPTEIFLLQTSKVQRDQRQQMKNELQALQQSTFARYDDDSNLEDYRKSIIHKDDPMAAQAVAKRNDGKVEGRPIYKGPSPKPNRFGIRPGHRWDANDRGNGFEDKLLAMRYSAQHHNEQAYRYSTSDM